MKILTMSQKPLLQRRSFRRSTMLQCIPTKMEKTKMMALSIRSNLWHQLLSNCQQLNSWVVRRVSQSITTSPILLVALRVNCLQSDVEVAAILNLAVLAVCPLSAVLAVCLLLKEDYHLREHQNRTLTSKTTITSHNLEAALAAKLRNSRRRSRR